MLQFSSGSVPRGPGFAERPRGSKKDYRPSALQLWRGAEFPNAAAKAQAVPSAAAKADGSKGKGCMPSDHVDRQRPHRGTPIAD